MGGHYTNKFALAMATALALVLLPTPGSAGEQCAPPDQARGNIILANPAHQQTTLTETVFFVVSPLLEDADLPVGVDNTLESQAQGVDALVVRFGCRLVGGSYHLSGEDGGANAFKMMMRFYDNDQGLTGLPTACDAQLSGPIPSGTWFAVVVLCEGTPFDLAGVKPTSVLATLTMQA